MGNLTSGEIAILVVQGCHILAAIYMKYDKHLFFSTCCDGRCCLVSNDRVDTNPENTINTWFSFCSFSMELVHGLVNKIDFMILVCFFWLTPKDTIKKVKWYLACMEENAVLLEENAKLLSKLRSINTWF